MASGASFQPPSERTKAHFESTPWAIKYFEDPTLQPFEPTLTVNSFIGNTLNTPNTILAWQYFQKTPASTDNYPEVLGLVKLGCGVNGLDGVCHVGFLSTLLDETAENATDFARPEGSSTMTARLNVSYKKAVSTPGVILTRAVVVKREGKKLTVKTAIEDGTGTVLAVAEALFIIIDNTGAVKL